ncbi:PPE domain-containing protein [Mycobacterium asiaticum]|uniref:PPE domain-containing protein n=1 Tax=Mycobacterium asiaticum TaxID=1790 RepID=A0A1A3NML1_MYCAS|nr:hypothetical protein A5635_20270 [Mycobacterium asiaticum]
MNFSVLPPEINSLRMFSGAGSAPMLAAAGAWSGLADELGLAAESFASVTGSLVDQVWQGAAASAMAAAAVPYAGWAGAAHRRPVVQRQRVPARAVPAAGARVAPVVVRVAPVVVRVALVVVRVRRGAVHRQASAAQAAWTLPVVVRVAQPIRVAQPVRAAQPIRVPQPVRAPPARR